jgi:hypothetical protein
MDMAGSKIEEEDGHRMDMEHWGDRRSKIEDRRSKREDHGHGSWTWIMDMDHGGIEGRGLTLPFLLYKKTLAMVPPADL